MKKTFIMTYMLVRLNLTGRLNKSNWICHSTYVWEGQHYSYFLTLQITSTTGKLYLQFLLLILFKRTPENLSVIKSQSYTAFNAIRLICTEVLWLNFCLSLSLNKLYLQILTCCFPLCFSAHASQVHCHRLWWDTKAWCFSCHHSNSETSQFAKP